MSCSGADQGSFEKPSCFAAYSTIDASDVWNRNVGTPELARRGGAIESKSACMSHTSAHALDLGVGIHMLHRQHVTSHQDAFSFCAPKPIPMPLMNGCMPPRGTAEAQRPADLWCFLVCQRHHCRAAGKVCGEVTCRSRPHAPSSFAFAQSLRCKLLPSRSMVGKRSAAFAACIRAWLATRLSPRQINPPRLWAPPTDHPTSCPLPLHHAPVTSLRGASTQKRP
ncbi:hypothetical protein IWX50DRAFT_233593 [Phyllosticta citricarpa]